MPLNLQQVRVIDPVLSTVALGYANPDNVGNVLFPKIPVPKRGGRVIMFSKESFYKYNARRAPGGDVARVMYGYTSDPIALVQDALEGQVPREWLEETADVPNLDLSKMAVTNAMRSIALLLEIEQAELAQDASKYDSNHKITLSGTSMWSNTASNPKAQMDTYKEAVRASIGAYPNALALSPSDKIALANHPTIIDKFKYTSADALTEVMLARYFELDIVVTGKAVYVPEGNETAVQTDVWTDSVLAYVPKANYNMGVPSYGYTYQLAQQPLVEQGYYEQKSRSWLYPVTYDRRPYLTGMQAGFLISGAS